MSSAREFPYTAGSQARRSQGARGNWRTNVTVLTGDLNFNDTVDARGVTRKASDINTAGSGNSIRVLYAYGQGGVLDGFTVSAGYALNDEGGGMMDVAGSVTIRNCTFAGNFSGQSGGGALQQEFSFYCGELRHFEQRSPVGRRHVH